MVDSVSISEFDPACDDLWELKCAFERELGAATGDDGKQNLYTAKLTDEYKKRYQSWVDQCVEEEPGCIRLAVRNDRRVGYAFVLPASLSMIWDAAVLNELYVRPEDRGQGIADRLVERCLAHVREQPLPINRIVLDVDGDNERAKSFYRRHGFSRWGEMLVKNL